MRTTRILAAVMAATLVLVAGAHAQVTPTSSYDPKAAFAQTDQNADGSVDLEEFHQRIVDVFYYADTDKDGFLSVTELQQLPASEPMNDADKNADGKVTLREFVRIRFLQFQSTDTDHDGELTLTEVLIVYQVTP